MSDENTDFMRRVCRIREIQGKVQKCVNKNAQDLEIDKPYEVQYTPTEKHRIEMRWVRENNIGQEPCLRETKRFDTFDRAKSFCDENDVVAEVYFMTRHESNMSVQYELVYEKGR